VGQSEGKTEKMRCSKCDNIVDVRVISEVLGTPSIKGVPINKVVKVDDHKLNGFFSSKCKGSGSTHYLKLWHPSNKVRKIQCRYCKRSVDAYILNNHSRISRLTHDVDKKTTTIIMKLLYHKSGSRKCSGTGRIAKERKNDFIDNGHP
jgi:hypothetical protein